MTRITVSVLSEMKSRWKWRRTFRESHSNKIHPLIMIKACGVYSCGSFHLQAAASNKTLQSEVPRGGVNLSTNALRDCVLHCAGYLQASTKGVSMNGRQRDDTYSAVPILHSAL